MKILVISLAGIGDTLLATPLIHELRVNFPDATIDALVMWAGSRDLLEGNPHLNRVFHKNLIKDGVVSALKFLSGIRRHGYDVSLNTYPQSKIQYRVVARLVNARRRLSHGYDNSGWLDGLLVDQSLVQDYTLHSVDNNLKFLRLIGAQTKLSAHESEIFLTDEERQWAEKFLGARDLAGRRILGIHVGSGTTKNLALRRWPLENYIALAKKLTAAHPETAVLLFGGPEEKRDHESILAATQGRRVQEAASRNLREAAALLQHCRAFLSVDTALMHVAAAMKVPAQIVIETPTFNQTIAPHRRPYVLVRNPVVNGRNLEYYRYDGRAIQGSEEELKRCMSSVTVADVFGPVEKALTAT